MSVHLIDIRISKQSGKRKSRSFLTLNVKVFETMVMLKRFSLLVALLPVFGCSTGSDKKAADDYFADDYALAVPAEKAKPAKPRADRSVPAAAEQPAAQDERFGYSASETKTSAVSETVSKVEGSVAELKQALRQNKETFKNLKGQSAEKAARYYEIVAHINARLQIGTTPGNPELTEMWKQASAALTEMGDKVQEMKILSGEVNKQSAQINALLGNIAKTFTVPGALESDHERLKDLEDETNLTLIGQNRLASELTAQVDRQMQAFKNESAQVAALAVAIRNGKPYGAEAAAAPVSLTRLNVKEPVSAVPTAKIAGRRPLMTIRFDRADVAYEQPLYRAVKAALDKRPNTDFELVAISSAKAENESEALEKAQTVRDSLTAMGLPDERVVVSKTTSAVAKSAEVQLFLK